MRELENAPAIQKIRDRVYHIDRLASMPQVVWQLFAALRSDQTDVSDLERLIESDPALAGKVLKTANSVYYGLSHKVTTISRAIVVIGFWELELVALSAGLSGIFRPGRSWPGFSLEALWQHNLAVSWVARELALEAGHAYPNEVLVAGLLHDLGKLVLVSHWMDDFSRLLAKLEEGVPYYMAEEHFNLEHAWIGYWLAQRWDLPRVHAVAIRDHHHPSPDDPDFDTTCLVSLADRLVKRLGFGLVHAARSLETTGLDQAPLSLPNLLTVARKARAKIPAMLETWRQVV